LIYYKFSTLKSISEIDKRLSEKEKHTAMIRVSTWVCHMAADISMMSSEGSGWLTSAVDPIDISVDQSTLTSLRSKGQTGPPFSGPTGQPHPKADRWDPRVSTIKRKEKGKGHGGLVTGLKVLGRLGWPNRLMAWLGSHELARISGLIGRLDQQAGLALQVGFDPNRPSFSSFSLCQG
jgi:hypothetical protein